jgi:hypothetical protein
MDHLVSCLAGTVSACRDSARISIKLAFALFSNRDARKQLASFIDGPQPRIKGQHWNSYFVKSLAAQTKLHPEFESGDLNIM